MGQPCCQSLGKSRALFGKCRLFSIHGPQFGQQRSRSRIVITGPAARYSRRLWTYSGATLVSATLLVMRSWMSSSLRLPERSKTRPDPAQAAANGAAPRGARR